MDLVSLLSLLLIAAGAALMVICILRFGPGVRRLKQVSEDEFVKIKPLVILHIALMVFFLIGYGAVGFSIIWDIRLPSELFVGMIFFFGALFVLLGIRLQSKLTAALKYRYDTAIRANAALEAEQNKLSLLNQRLLGEIDDRIRAQEALACAKAGLQNIIDSLPEQVMVINRDHSVALVNRPVLDENGLDHLPPSLHCHAMSHGKATPCDGVNHPCPLVGGQDRRTGHLRAHSRGCPGEFQDRRILPRHHPAPAGRKPAA